MAGPLSFKREGEMEIELLRIGGAQRGTQVWMAYQWAEVIEEKATVEERRELERAITRVCRLLAPVMERALAQNRDNSPQTGGP